MVVNIMRRGNLHNIKSQSVCRYVKCWSSIRLVLDPHQARLMALDARGKPTAKQSMSIER